MSSGRAESIRGDWGGEFDGDARSERVRGEDRGLHLSVASVNRGAFFADAGGDGGT